MIRRPRKRQLSKWILPIISMAVLIYFSYHLIEGNHGWRAWRTLEQDIEISQKELEDLKEKEDEITNKVTLLRSDSLDEDMLDERVRAMLGNAKESEIIVIDEEDDDHTDHPF
jgi:cell division protein FtsB